MIRHLVVEGLPGAGKTTLAHRLTRFAAIRGIRSAVVPERVHDLSNSRFFRDFMTHDQAKIQFANQLVEEQYELVIHDRSWISTLAYSKALGEPTDSFIDFERPINSMMAQGVLFVYLEFSDLRKRRKVGIAREKWDDDGFAVRWDRHAREELVAMSGGRLILLEAKPDIRGAADILTKRLKWP